MKNNVHDLIIQTAPIIIWEIQKEWAACKFGVQNKMYHKKMEYQVLWNITTALKIIFPTINKMGSWPSMCENIERLQRRRNVIQVVWQKPKAR